METASHAGGSWPESADITELYQIADELRAAALPGLKFDKDPYSLERCRTVLTCSARIVAAVEGRDPGPIGAPSRKTCCTSASWTAPRPWSSATDRTC